MATANTKKKVKIIMENDCGLSLKRMQVGKDKTNRTNNLRKCLLFRNNATLLCLRFTQDMLNFAGYCIENIMELF